MSESPAQPVPTQPPDSKITFASANNSLTFMVPRSGFHGGAAALLIFSLVWMGICGFIFLIFLLTSVSDFSLFLLLPLAFISFFVLIGLIALLASFQLAYKKAVILATTDALVYEQTGPFRKAGFTWPPKTISAICTDFSGTAVNERRFRELRILTTDGNKKGFFDGRPDNELEWLAYTLRTFYNLPANAPSPPEE